MPLILLNKPFRVLSQFSAGDGRRTLASYVTTKGVYPAGRLDHDSEGLLLLTDDGALQARISQPGSLLHKTYWVQVEGEPSADQLSQLVAGVTLKDGHARALQASSMPEPSSLWPRDPPIRVRKSIPDSWLRVVLNEGRNRQVRRMTAATGLPTLRLVRYAVGPWSAEGLAPGETRQLDNQAAWRELDQYSRSRQENQRS